MFEVDEQLYCAFIDIARERYISKKTKEFAVDFPEKYTQVGEEGAKAFFRVSLEKAEQYNMVADRELNGLQTLMQHLGCDFDHDPQYPWARFKRFSDKEPSRRHEEPESYISLCRVYKYFYKSITEERGTQGSHLENAHARWRSVDFRLLTSLSATEDVLRFLQWLYPERFTQIPFTALSHGVLPAAVQKAFSHNLDNTTGTAIFACLIFFYGIGVDTDPLCAPLMLGLQNGPARGMQREQFFWGHLKTYL